MSQSSPDGPATDPTDTPHRGLGELDPDQFVGEPPAGDDSPGDFMSRDQQPGGQDEQDEDDEEDDA